MTEVKGYAAFSPSAQLIPHKWQSPTLGADWIEVAISHCGICHSDIHLLDNGLGVTKFPFVPGHEIIGSVSALGSDVRRFKQGDIVGVGWQSGSCGRCAYCDSGNENCCLAMESTCVNQFGGYADRFSCNEKFAIKIPDGLSPVTAAPLMCGGVTVYQPLRYYNVTPNQKVGVIGIGGLGHIALQFLAHFGCEVIAISSTERKKKEALELGADSFLTARDLSSHEISLDVLINTTSADLDLESYFKLLKPQGKLILIGLGGSQVTVPAAPLILGQREVAGSWIGSPSMIEEMLNFSLRHNIEVKTEIFSLSDVNKAIEKVRRNEVTYRAVLTA